MKNLFSLTIAMMLILGAASHADAKSFKRGVSENQFTFEGQMSVIEPGVSWYYNWGHAPGQGYQGQVANFSGFEFIPMCWNGVNAATLRSFYQQHPEVKYILGFNEPNFKAQANMTPAVAAERWPQVQEIANEFGLKIVSPALNYSPDAPYQDPMKWMEEWVALVGENAFDYIALHNYGGLGVMQETCQRFWDRFHKPIWVTEWCLWPGGAGNVYVAPEAQISSMIASVEWLETTPYIYRYAWFKCVGAYNGSNQPNYGLQITKTGEGERELTQQGWVYTYMTDFNPDVWHSINTTIAASEYIKSSSIMLDKGANTECPRPIEISQFNAGAWANYQFDVPKAGDYNLILTVSGQGEPVRFDPNLKIVAINADGSEGSILASKKFTISGDIAKYTTVTFNITLPAGRQTIRVADAGPYQPSGIHLSTLMLADPAGIDGITADTTPDAPVSVYTVTGALVRSGVRAAEATAGLAPGIYLVGGKKIIVK